MIKHKIKIRNVRPAEEKIKILNIPIVYQVQSEWCWAACATMVSHFLGDTKVKRCEFAHMLFNQVGCCKHNSSAACNKPCQWNDIKNIYSLKKIKSTFITGIVLFSKIVAEINLGRPIEIGFHWTFGGAHVVLATGYKSLRRRQYVYINDPIRGGGWQTYKDIVVASGKGVWSHTWIDIKKGTA